MNWSFIHSVSATATMRAPPLRLMSEPVTCAGAFGVADGAGLAALDPLELGAAVGEAGGSVGMAVGAADALAPADAEAEDVAGSVPSAVASSTIGPRVSP